MNVSHEIRIVVPEQVLNEQKIERTFLFYKDIETLYQTSVSGIKFIAGMKYPGIICMPPLPLTNT